MTLPTQQDVYVSDFIRINPLLDGMKKGVGCLLNPRWMINFYFK